MYGLISWVVKKVYEWGKNIFGPDSEPVPEPSPESAQQISPKITENKNETR